ncbi:hypothetical protein B0H21DRAFT_819790 [Amylocystis lapponica]|nr:hypothetical protein B0H21DRAFT_819790 [Amylocystis lapponica]
MAPTTVTILTFSSLLDILSLQGLYLVGYAWLLGMSIWVTFFAGVIVLRIPAFNHTLTYVDRTDRIQGLAALTARQQFGTLQHRVFPVYFLASIILSATLLGLWTYSHPSLLEYVLNPTVADVAQFYALATPLISAASNSLVIGPLTSRTMFQRHKLEKAEGKGYNEPGVSDEMKTLNQRFGLYHGVSSLLNLYSVVALLFHGLWIGNYGAGIKGF